MDATENKKLMQHIFAELSKGESLLLIDSMADDFRWNVTGTTKWSKIYEGKHKVVTELFRALRSKIGDRMRTTAHRFIAEGDHVVVEARGENITTDGRTYNNTYCFVFRLADGKLQK
jgi:ketosteroid isomerase-like protein